MFVGLGNAAFQFTRPRGARRPANRRPTPSKRFNSRAHGGRDAPNRGRPSRGGVSIHAPTGGATAEPANVRKGAAGFNSRAHGGRDRPSPSSSRASGVSIHAPTGGATMFPVISSFVSAGFNSRAHGGRDRHDTIVSRRGRRFNSRAHGGRDLPRLDEVSDRPEFQFTRPRGARPETSSRRGSRRMFQFTRPRGARPFQSAPSLSRSSFNSRAHGGRDLSLLDRLADESVSIHAPTGGATAYILSYPIVGLQGGFPRTCPFFWIVFSYCQ